MIRDAEPDDIRGMAAVYSACITADAGYLPFLSAGDESAVLAWFRLKPLVACLVAEIVLTAFFLIVIMGSTDARAPKGFAPIAIGLCLTLIHLISIPITNTSVNPARSTGQALFVQGWALGQLWLFWVAPLIGGILGGLLYNGLFSKED